MPVNRKVFPDNAPNITQSGAGQSNVRKNPPKEPEIVQSIMHLPLPTSADDPFLDTNDDHDHDHDTPEEDDAFPPEKDKYGHKKKSKYNFDEEEYVTSEHEPKRRVVYNQQPQGNLGNMAFLGHYRSAERYTAWRMESDSLQRHRLDKQWRKRIDKFIKRINFWPPSTLCCGMCFSGNGYYNDFYQITKTTKPKTEEPLVAIPFMVGSIDLRRIFTRMRGKKSTVPITPAKLVNDVFESQSTTTIAQPPPVKLANPVQKIAPPVPVEPAIPPLSPDEDKVRKPLPPTMKTVNRKR